MTACNQQMELVTLTWEQLQEAANKELSAAEEEELEAFIADFESYPFNLQTKIARWIMYEWLDLEEVSEEAAEQTADPGAVSPPELDGARYYQ